MECYRQCPKVQPRTIRDALKKYIRRPGKAISGVGELGRLAYRPRKQKTQNFRQRI